MVFQRLIQHKFTVIALIALSISLPLALLALSGVRLPILSFLELKTIDLRFRVRGAVPAADDVVIVAIDEPSLKIIGRWPWSRKIMAGLIDKLDRAGVRAIGVDLIFSEPEIHSGLSLLQYLIHAYQELKLLNGSAASQAFYEEMIEFSETADHDGLLAEIIAESGKVILSMVFQPGNDQLIEPLPPFSILAESAAAVGFVNVTPDADGSVRRVELIRQHENRQYGSLALLMAQAHLSAIMPEDFITVIAQIPVDADGLMLVNYNGPVYSIPYYSAADVLYGNLPPELFRDKSVFIGGAASGLGDHWVSPYSEIFWGVELQAAIMQNIIHQYPLKRLPNLKSIDAGIILLMGLILSLTLPFINIRRAVLLSFSLAVFYIIITQILFNRFYLVMLWLYPLLTIFFISAAAFFYRYAGEGREKRWLKHAFQHYLNPNVIERILQHPDKLMLGGEERELTVMFTDIRGFTQISEKMTPEILVHFMNQYLMSMTDILIKNGGTLDKYIGDAIMAIFGAPEEQPDHAERACKTAVEMLEALIQLKDDWQRQGLPEIRIGAGISTGKMVVGNVGSMKRFNYTVMGDTVNQAARLEGLTKQYEVDIIVNEETRNQAAGKFQFRELGIVQVKGRSQPVKIYALIS